MGLGNSGSENRKRRDFCRRGKNCHSILRTNGEFLRSVILSCVVNFYDVKTIRVHPVGTHVTEDCRTVKVKVPDSDRNIFITTTR